METSIFLAKALGAFITIFGFVLYFNRKNLDIIYNLVKHKEYLFFSGIFNLVVGILIVFMHNVWVADWRVVVTFMGWIAIVKGLIRLLRPGLVKSSATLIKKNKNALNIIFAGMLALGLYLLYVGFTTPFMSFF